VNKNPHNKFYIESLGCAKNQVDSEEIIASLLNAGYEYVAHPDDASIIVVNTCGFIEEAKKESIEVTLGFREMYPGKKIIMAGCLSERYKDTLGKELPEVDAFVGVEGASKIIEAVGAVTGLSIPLDRNRNHEYGRTKFLSFPGSTYLKISDGCSNRCSYCAIPLIRGDLASRSIESIVGEIRLLLDQGILEISLVAQDAGSFGADRGGAELHRLLEAIVLLPEQFWIRLLYIHPDHFPFDILEIMKRDSRVLPYFDIPFQHASKKILAKMGRRGDIDTYLGLIERIRGALPDAVIRSTFLVGFPGESDEDFKALLEFQERALLDWAGAFCYSREEGTVAYDFPNRVKKTDALSRKKTIEERQTEISEKVLARFVGREVGVLVEEKVEGQSLYLGRGFMHAPEIDGCIILHGANLECGKIYDSRIVRLNNIDFEAELF
jgi:ribosomal protein S12 methylthiotransferase